MSTDLVRAKGGVVAPPSFLEPQLRVGGADECGGGVWRILYLLFTLTRNQTLNLNLALDDTPTPRPPPNTDRFIKSSARLHVVGHEGDRVD